MTRFRTGGEEREASVEATRDGRRRVVVDGTAFDVDLRRLGPGAFVRRNGRGSDVFHCVRDGRLVHLAWQGITYRIEERDEDAPAGHRGGHGALEAPMPGKVIALHVELGQRVAKGDEILIVEAMKMENALRAPRDGVVRAVHVRVGDAVTPGVVLVELE